MQINYRTIRYDSWQAFKNRYCADLFDGDFVFGKYIFRGLGNAKWDLVTSFDRIYGSRSNSARKTIENELIAAFCTNCDRHVKSHYKFSEMKMFEKMSLAQHYGVPTRLLDWSYSPFISAYFAFRYSDDYSKDNCIAIWALNKEHDIWNDKGVSIEECVGLDNEHQKRQLGCFTMLKSPAKSINSFVNMCFDSGEDVTGALTKIEIPASDFKTALHELEGMNISASTIFGGFQGCAEAAHDLISLKYNGSI